MNEKFLSRGKRKDNGEWVEGYYSPLNIPLMGKMGDFINVGGYEAVEIIPETVGCCTGLTDKNGTLIFEGDINEYKGNRYVIKYLEEYMRFSPVKPGTVFTVFDYTQSKIIGNIHDNPEMLSRADMPVSNDVFQPVFQPTTPENFELMHG